MLSETIHGEISPTTVLLKLETQYINAGDFSINRLMVENLSELGKAIVDLSEAPAWFRKQWREGVRAPDGGEIQELEAGQKWMEAAKVLAHRGKCVALIPTGGYPLPRNLRWAVRYMRLGLLVGRLQRWGAQVAWIGSSFSLSPSAWRWVGIRALARFNHLGIRDHRTVEALRRAGVLCASYFPDWTLVGGMQREASSVHEPRSADGPVVCSFRREETLDTRDLSEMLQCIGRVIQERRRPLWLHSQVQGDEDYTSRLFDQAGIRPDRVVEAHADEAKARRTLREASLVVSNRLHVCLFAITEGTPAIAVAGTRWAEKIRGVVDSARVPCPVFQPSDWRRAASCVLGEREPGFQLARDRCLKESREQGRSWLRKAISHRANEVAISGRKSF